MSVGVTDENGFTISSVPDSWVAVFGFYGRSLRTPDLVPSQVVLLQQLLQQAGEDTVALVILADADRRHVHPEGQPVAVTRRRDARPIGLPLVARVG